MTKYIEKELLLKEATAEGAYGYVDARQINGMPTEDIVRCYECKHYNYGDCVIMKFRARDEDFFCADGERK